MKNESLYKTKDFYLATCILASGYSLLKLERISPKTMEFVFNVSSDIANDLIHKHWNRELKISSRDFIDSINELKTRLYDRSFHAT